MCGFVALAGAGAQRERRIERGVAAIRHRGPDGAGVHRTNDGQVALGHARLAIIDLSERAAQPMPSSDGKAILTFNGEIYNYRELRGAVEAPLKSTSDTEVLLELLRQESTRALGRLRGMFAFAYWDGEELLIVRDRIGIKPVFYAAQPGFIGAASEIGALVAMGGLDTSIDPQAIDDYLTYLYVPPPRTGIRGIKQLPPAHLLRWRPGWESPRVERYWAVPTEPPIHAPSAEEVRSIVEDAVKCHLVADVPVGVFLSGGIDSSTIVALAAKHYGPKLRTFNVVFGSEGKRLDERHYAREIASQFGTEHAEIPVSAKVTDILPKVAAHFGQPFGNPTSILSYVLSQETRKHVAVALAGDGGDEVLGGYPRYQGMLLAQLSRVLPRSALLAAAGLAKHVPHGLMGDGIVERRLQRFLSFAAEQPETMYFRWVTYLGTSAKADLYANRREFWGDDDRESTYGFLKEIRDRAGQRGMADAAALVDLESFLPQNVLAYGDRMSMAHGLEVRVPFCDHLLIEKLGSLSMRKKMPYGQQKGLLRWAMRKDLPVSVLTHKKIGFNPPISAWIQRDLATLLDDFLDVKKVEDRGIFSSRAISRLRTAFSKGSVDVAYALWSIVALEAWMRWLDGARAEADRADSDCVEELASGGRG